ncbi:ORF6N domain-containing protein [Xenorhabdus entomophaga]|uniref:ORF6N domain-containing protein n=1 Tax=Xenorhabdus entomophaga TaxID=3136257 RepID=UPI0030F40F62
MLSISVNKLCKNSNSVESMIAIMHNSVPVITTELLADVYGTDEVNIKMNFSRNTERFTHGKHYFKLEGADLKQFKNRVTESYSVEYGAKIVGKRARSLILWTERGAARHAKMLDTDKAWDVFEKLEDFYFNQKESEPVTAKTTVQQRNPLKNATCNHINLSTEVDNVNAAYRELGTLIDVWDRLDPHLSVLTPDIAKVFNTALSNIDGSLFSLKTAIERNSKVLLN